VLALLTYELSRNYLAGQRERTAKRQAFVNARLVAEGLRAADVDVQQLLASLETPADSQSLVQSHGEWYSTSVAARPAQLPAGLRDTVLSGAASTQRLRIGGTARLVVGVPIPSVGAAYFEIFALTELASTLHVLAISLLVAAGLTTLAGAALGAWAARRVLSPVHALSTSAARVAAGDLDTRIPPDADPDLASVASSFNAMVDALQRRIDRDARFAADVAHELRSPLTTLVTSLVVLRRRSQQWDEPSRTAVALMSTEVGRFQRLVEDLLEMARADAGADDGALEHVRVGELVLHTLARSPYAQVPTEIDDAAARTVVLADKRRLERTLVNLLANAAQHADGAGLVAARRVGDVVRIEVHDRGPGVRDEDRERIFDRFARARAGSRAGGGVGLGLALVADHVQRQGGRVWVSDSPIGGACFVVELPVVHE
jgi:signal transduction histidine kinase